MRDEIKNYAADVTGVLESLSGEYVYEVKEVNKNNTTLTAIVVKKEGSNAGAAIYVDGMYEKLSVSEAARQILEQAKKALADFNLDVSFYTDFEKVKDKLTVRLFSRNRYAQDLAHRPVGDLYETLSVDVEMNSQLGSIGVKPEHLDSWGITAAEAFEIAEKNMNAKEIKVMNIMDMLGELMGTPAEGVELPDVYVCMFADSDTFGAPVMLTDKFREEMEEKFPDGYYILPSSVHEVIVLPQGSMQAMALADMVKQINASVVDPSEQLSDSIYECINGEINVVDVESEVA